MKRITSLHGKGAGALTPDPDRPTRAVKQPAPPAVVGSLTCERVLYEALQWERARNRALAAQIYKLEELLKNYRVRSRVKIIASKLKPNRNPEPKRTAGQL